MNSDDLQKTLYARLIVKAKSYKNGMRHYKTIKDVEDTASEISILGVPFIYNIITKTLCILKKG